MATKEKKKTPGTYNKKVKYHKLKRTSQKTVFLDPGEVDSFLGYSAHRGYGKEYTDHLTVMAGDCTKVIKWEFNCGEKGSIKKMERAIKVLTEAYKTLKNVKTHTKKVTRRKGDIYLD